MIPPDFGLLSPRGFYINRHAVPSARQRSVRFGDEASQNRAAAHLRAMHGILL